MKAREGFILRNLVGELVLMPVGAEIRSFQGLIRLNGLSAFIWQHLQQPTTPDALLDAILSEYDIDTPPPPPTFPRPWSKCVPWASSKAKKLQRIIPEAYTLASGIIISVFLKTELSDISASPFFRCSSPRWPPAIASYGGRCSCPSP